MKLLIISILNYLLPEEDSSFILFKIYKTYNESYLNWDDNSINALGYTQVIIMSIFVYYISKLFIYFNC